MIANLHNADIPRPVLNVIVGLRELGPAVYLVSGCVRDMVRKPSRNSGFAPESVVILAHILYVLLLNAPACRGAVEEP